MSPNHEVTVKCRLDPFFAYEPIPLLYPTEWNVGHTSQHLTKPRDISLTADGNALRPARIPAYDIGASDAKPAWV